MNPHQFRDEEDLYYYFQPPWTPYENQNIIMRVFQLKENFDQVFEAVETLDEIKTELSEGAAYEEVIRDGRRAIFELMDGLESFLYNFPEILQEEWFHNFWQTVAGATWRAQEGKLEGERRFKIFLNDILAYFPGTIYGSIYRDFNRFLEFYGSDIQPNQVPDDFRLDVYEARDQFCLGYYSTALFVLGRAVEKALLQLGQERKIETIKAFGREVDWKDARFYSRKEAMKNIQKPNSTEKLISQRQYHEISVLVNYRNNVAHSEHEDIERDEALRQINNAFSLLKELTEQIEELEKLDDDEINPIEGQKAG